MAEQPPSVVVGDGTLPPGLTVARNYRIVRPLAEGGFGTVYLGENTTLEQRVVVKVLRTGERGAGAEEARMLASLDHPNVVHVYAYDEQYDCIVMQYLAGESLFAYQDKLDLVTAVRVVCQVALALKAVHAKGLVHRDVKPENVMLGPERAWVKLIDMGTALRIGRTLEFAAGTPEFCPAEQFNGSIGAHPANDIYALGATLFTLCSRRLPFVGTPQELARAHAYEPVPDLSTAFEQERASEAREKGKPVEPLDPTVDFVLEKVGELVSEMMAKEMRDRPDARAVASRLEALEARFSGGETAVGFKVPVFAGVKAAPTPMPKSSTMVLPRIDGKVVGNATQQAIAAATAPRRTNRTAVVAVLALLLLLGLWWWQRGAPQPVAAAPVPKPAPELLAAAKPVEAPEPVQPPTPVVAPQAPIDELAPLPTKPPAPAPAVKKMAVVVEAPAACVYDQAFREYARRARDGYLKALNRQSPEVARPLDKLETAMADRDCQRVNVLLSELDRTASFP